MIRNDKQIRGNEVLECGEGCWRVSDKVLWAVRVIFLFDGLSRMVMNAFSVHLVDK